MKLPRLILYIITFGFHCLAEDTKGYTILSEAVGKNNPLLPGQNYMFLEKWKPRSGTIYAKITDYAHYKLVVGEVATNNDDRDFIGSTFEMEATGGSIPNSPLNGQVVNAYTSRFEVNMFFDRKMKEFRESRSGPPAYEFVGTTMATLGSFKAQGEAYVQEHKKYNILWNNCQQYAINLAKNGKKKMPKVRSRVEGNIRQR